MPFTDPVVGGEGTLIRQAIKTPDYVPGSVGWSINKDGTAEFNDVIVRGDLVTGPHDAGLYHIEAFPTPGPGGATSGTGYQGPDPGTVGTAAHVWLTQNYPAPTLPPTFNSYIELYASHGIQYICDGSLGHDFVGDVTIRGDVFLPAPGGVGINADANIDIDSFAGIVNLRRAGTTWLQVGSAIRVYQGAGIAYHSTTGTGSPSVIGFKWGSPNIYARVDNAVSAVVGTVSDGRLKHDKRPLTDAINRLRKLKPVDYLPMDLEGNLTLGLRRPGLVAQDVELVEPWAVPPVDMPGDLMTVDYLGLVALLVQGLVELADTVNPSNNNGV